MKIDCDTCVVRGDACSDCVVSFLTIPVRDGLRSADLPRAPIEIDVAQARAMRTLAEAGLAAPLRHLA
jgi:hypothetical protein